MSSAITLKTCRACKKELPTASFGVEKRNRDGMRGECLTCRSELRGIRDGEFKNYRKTPRGRMNSMWHTLKKGADQRGLEFLISQEWLYEKILLGRCEKTGIPFVLDAENHNDSVTSKGQVRNPWAPSIDRVDSSKGYTEDNCVIVCYVYNMAKGSFDESVLEMFCRGYLSNV